MKTRQQIIDEILTQARAHPLLAYTALEASIKTLQDALLFALAQDLNISLNEKSV